ncbi:MAG: prepilin-type N-terminal cleavage/methylation domain-containing protein [Proteobacteria bacterium]|nr:prepilin-type N-terminal cleavage/methylation domain-containing protein [Pseudomonadota bacterium]
MNRPRKQSWRQDHGLAIRGFSLLELIIVLALLGIMAGVVAPATGRFLDKLSFRKQTASLVAGTRYARLMAVSKGGPVAMRYDTSAHLLFFSGAVEEKKEIELSGGAVFELRPETLVFYPDGLATPGRMVSRRGSSSQEFRIDPLTGIPVRQ